MPQHEPKMQHAHLSIISLCRSQVWRKSILCSLGNFLGLRRVNQFAALPTGSVVKGFPCGSAGRESACNAGRPGFDPCVGKIPWRRERLPTRVFWPGEFHGLYSPWGRKESDTTEAPSCSLFCSVVKNLPAIQETWQEPRAQRLGGEDPLEEEMATHSSIFAWEIPWTEEPGRYGPWSHKRVGHDLATRTQQKQLERSNQISWSEIKSVLV